MSGALRNKHVTRYHSFDRIQFVVWQFDDIAPMMVWTFLRYFEASLRLLSTSYKGILCNSSINSSQLFKLVGRQQHVSCTHSFLKLC
jgi:hypothetical protein